MSYFHHSSSFHSLFTLIGGEFFYPTHVFYHFYFSSLDFFCMWTVFKVFIEFVTILLLFYGGLGVFGCKAYKNLALPIRGQTFTLRIRRPSAPTGQPGQSLPSHSWCLFLFSLRMMKPVSFTESDGEGHVGIVARVRFLALGKTTVVYSSLLGLGFFTCAM